MHRRVVFYDTRTLTSSEASLTLQMTVPLDYRVVTWGFENGNGETELLGARPVLRGEPGVGAEQDGYTFTVKNNNYPSGEGAFSAWVVAETGSQTVALEVERPMNVP